LEESRGRGCITKYEQEHLKEKNILNNKNEVNILTRLAFLEGTISIQLVLRP
jgi:hypothetical protein